MSNKHFNKGTIWGSISSIEWKKTEGSTRFLQLKVFCRNSIYGNATVWVKMWGTQELGLLTAHHKQHPHDLYKFTGFFTQYEKEGKLYSGFSCYEWAEIDKSQDSRAAFVLVGDVIECDGKKIVLSLTRDQAGKPHTEKFSLWPIEAGLLSDIEPGASIKAKGVICPGEDYFGDSDGDYKPYITNIERGKSKTPAGQGHEHNGQSPNMKGK